MQATTFKSLAVGETFDFVDDSHLTWNSFYLRCAKTSARQYVDQSGVTHRVGSINCEVFHVRAQEAK